MNVYENIVILNASLTDEDVGAAIGRIKDIVANSGGSVLKTDIWGRKKLAYEIKKQNKGVYVLLLFKTPAATVKKLEEFYKVFDPVIRHMIVKLGAKQVKQIESLQSEEAEPAKSEG